MALITFISDFGKEDHYSAAVKASILRVNPNIQIIDISHEVEPFNLSHGAHIIKSVFREFPKGTVHLVAIETFMKEWGAIAMKLEDHFFVGPDNGILSLISEEPPAAVVDINKLKPIDSTFPARDLYASVAANLASGKSIQDLGPKTDEYVQLLNRQIKATKSVITGNVVRVDTYGNLISNIPRVEFENILNLNNGGAYEISLGREKVTRVHRSYHDVEPGECFCIFNSLGVLEVGINSGHASKLLGLAFDSPISIHFNP